MERKVVDIVLQNRTLTERLRVAVLIRNNLNARNIVSFMGYTIDPPCVEMEAEDPYGQPSCVLSRRHYISIRDALKIISNCIAPCESEERLFAHNENLRLLKQSEQV